MKFKLLDKIIWFHDLSDPTTERSGTITRVNKAGDLVWTDNQHKPEDCLYSAFAWPLEYAQQIRSLVLERYALKKRHDDLMRNVYELRNEITKTSAETHNNAEDLNH